jgi:CBS-domain-containing membrane protein
MTPNPLSFHKTDSVRKVAALLSFYGLDAAPVTDEWGRLVGMVTAASCTAWEEFSRRSSPLGFSPTDLEDTDVLEIVSPAVESVRDDASGREVIEKLVRRQSRRLYVINAENKLIGVISRSDLLQNLRVTAA